MPSPITASDFAPDQWGGNACDKFQNLVATNERMAEFLEWLLNESGEVSDAFIESMQARSAPLGHILIWPSSSLPSDKWKICDGSAVSRTIYASLFTLIGTTYGAGDGSTTFNLPDYQGRVPIGVNPDPLGAAVGARSVELTAANLPTHTHSIGTKKVDDVAFYDSSVARLEVFQIYTSGTDTVVTVAPLAGTGSATTGAAGSDDPTEVSVMQPSRANYFIIKVL